MSAELVDALDRAAACACRVWIVLFACAVLCCSAAAQSVEPNVDRNGSDYRSFELSAPDARMCRTNEAPSYCAHCALNELTSVKRLGYPAWVTEFDPDPNKPCGWTVYKDPKFPSAISRALA